MFTEKIGFDVGRYKLQEKKEHPITNVTYMSQGASSIMEREMSCTFLLSPTNRGGGGEKGRRPVL